MEFAKLDRNDADVYGLKYDYGSIMHYGELSCSTNRRPTMIAIDRRYQKTMGSEMISFTDIFMINEHYGCNGETCKHFAPPGCGQYVIAMEKRQTLECRLGFGAGVRDQFGVCNYMIRAPEGRKIEVEVQSVSHGYDYGGCPRGGVEVKAQKNQKLTGYRFCSTKGSEGPIVSKSNPLPVIIFSKVGTIATTVVYRYID
ncbi:unnamed protein product [Angiostrongylus costaricensis]|uniref:Astacin domain-containing protein n=1 Tax=Angiostrongylus costaricensis TaxID=334426 RepID=A0A0R3PS16_ANGCS|nr:unnamed protein product [Angiostrongylus costaricensis]